MIEKLSLVFARRCWLGMDLFENNQSAYNYSNSIFLSHQPIVVKSMYVSDPSLLVCATNYVCVGIW